jgi:hypothetical protein
MMKPSPRLPLVSFALAGWLAVAVSLLVHACNSSAQTASAVQVEARLLSGETLRGELVSVNEKEAVFQTGKDRITKALGELLSITFPASGSKTPVAADAPRTELRLLDGTTLLAQKFSLKQKQVECQLFNGQAVSVPLNRLHWLLVTAQEEKAREELQQALAKKHAQDVVLLLSRDGQAINTFLGVVLGGDEQGARLNFRLEDDVVPIDMARLRGLVLAQRERTGSSDGVRVQDRFGNTWLAAEITWEANRLRLRTGDGLTAELAFDHLASVDFSQGRLVYLSDLEPLRGRGKTLAGRCLAVSPRPQPVRWADLAWPENVQQRNHRAFPHCAGI